MPNATTSAFFTPSATRILSQQFDSMVNLLPMQKDLTILVSEVFQRNSPAKLAYNKTCNQPHPYAQIQINSQRPILIYERSAKNHQTSDESF